MTIMASAPSATDGDLAIVCGLTFALIWALMHWRFKTGWHMRSGRMMPSRDNYPISVCFLYAALPFTIASIGLTTGLSSGASI